MTKNKLLNPFGRFLTEKYELNPVHCKFGIYIKGDFLKVL